MNELRRCTIVIAFITRLMTLFSSICCSPASKKLTPSTIVLLSVFGVNEFRCREWRKKSFEFQEIIQHTRTTARDFQLLHNFSNEASALCFGIMQNDASRSGLSPFGYQLQVGGSLTWQSNQIFPFSLADEATEKWAFCEARGAIEWHAWWEIRLTCVWCFQKISEVTSRRLRIKNFVIQWNLLFRSTTWRILNQQLMTKPITS